MNDLISRQAAIRWVKTECNPYGKPTLEFESGKRVIEHLEQMPSAEPALRERALMLLLNWAVECDFGYDNFPEKYEQYKNEIEDMDYFDGMIYIAEKEVER